MFKRAKRRAAKLRLALCGPSGSGKTWSALKIAKGLGGRIALIDTESGSSELYSHLCDFDVANLEPPYAPDRYIEMIKSAEEAGYEILIIDSLSHAWAGPGGVLDMHDKAAKSVKNSFAAWALVTPRHNALVDAMLESRCHIIATLRKKTAYEVTHENGKVKPVKIGLAPVQRDGLEHEFTCVIDMSVDGHVASVSKDRTGLFEGEHFVPDEQVGRRLAEWLQDGRDSESREEDDDKNARLSVTVKLREAFAPLGFGELFQSYTEYVESRYGVDDIETLSPEAVDEQIRMLGQCASRKKKRAGFQELLMEGIAA